MALTSAVYQTGHTPTALQVYDQVAFGSGLTTIKERELITLDTILSQDKHTRSVLLLIHLLTMVLHLTQQQRLILLGQTVL